jgi:hypothetical protein
VLASILGAFRVELAPEVSMTAQMLNTHTTKVVLAEGQQMVASLATILCRVTLCGLDRALATCLVCDHVVTIMIVLLCHALSWHWTATLSDNCCSLLCCPVQTGGREGISARESTHLTLQTAGTQGIRMALYPRWL